MITDKEFLCWCKDGKRYLSLLNLAREIANKNAVSICIRQDEETSFFNEETIIYWFIGRPKSRCKDAVSVTAAKAISDLFHEIGHVLQPRIQIDDLSNKEGTEEKLEREKDAWEIAKKTFVESFPDLFSEFEHIFRDARNKSIDTYERAYLAREAKLRNKAEK